MLGHVMDDMDLGCRSPLVMAKLGFDLRTHYKDLVEAPLPDRLQELCDKLLGYAAYEDVADEDGK